jgi:hypothetical protein
VHYSWVLLAGSSSKVPALLWVAWARSRPVWALIWVLWALAVMVVLLSSDRLLCDTARRRSKWCIGGK